MENAQDFVGRVDLEEVTNFDEQRKKMSWIYMLYDFI